jgi:hypothetical protein
MSRATRVIGPWLGGMLSVYLMAALVPSAWCEGEARAVSPETSVTAADLVLTVHEGLLSLTAQDASLKEHLEAIGQQLSIEVVARIPADERITLTFAQISLAEALTRVRPHVDYLVLADAAKAPRPIRTLIVVSKWTGGTPSSVDRHQVCRSV